MVSFPKEGKQKLIVLLKAGPRTGTALLLSRFIYPSPDSLWWERIAQGYEF